MKNNQNKTQVYIVTKYVLASSIPEALKKEKNTEPHEVWLDSTVKNEIIMELKQDNKLLGFK